MNIELEIKEKDEFNLSRDEVVATEAIYQDEDGTIILSDGMGGYVLMDTDGGISIYDDDGKELDKEVKYRLLDKKLTLSND